MLHCLEVLNGLIHLFGVVLLFEHLSSVVLPRGELLTQLVKHVPDDRVILSLLWPEIL